MLLCKLNPHVVIFFSLVVFLLLRQSISEHDDPPSQLLKDSKLFVTRKIHSYGDESKEQDEADQYFDYSSNANKMTKKEKGNVKDEEKDDEKEKKEKEKEDEKEKKEKEEEGEKEKKEKEEDDEKEEEKDKKKRNKNEEHEGDQDEKIKKKKKKDKKSSSYALNSVQSLLSLTNAINENADVPFEIEQGCKKADFPLECEATSVSIGTDSEKLDSLGIFESSAKALSQALGVAKVSAHDSDMGVNAQVASVCEEVYQDAFKTMKGAIKAAAHKDRYMTSLKLSTVISDTDTCHDSIGQAYKSSKLAQVNVVLSKLAANTISLGDAALHFDTDE